MTQMHDLTGKSLGALLAGHPRALKALEESLEKQATRGKAAAAKAAEDEESRGRCPYCKAAGKSYTVAGTVFRVKPFDCCQQATFEAAVDALRYAKNPTGDKQERVDAALKFKELEPLIVEPSLKAELAAERERLKTIGERQIDSGRWPAKTADDGQED